MNPEDIIRVAIDRLEKLRAASTQPTDGGKAWIQGQDGVRYETSREIYTGPLSGTSSDVVSGIESEDAALIVTLHRTIDAQLALLRHTLNHYRGDLGISIPRFVVDLARAILGGAA